MCPLQDIPAVSSRWMYCHLVMCYETCMFKPLKTQLSPLIKCGDGEYLFVFDQHITPFFSNQQPRHSLEVEVWDGGGGAHWQQIDVTNPLPGDHSADLMQGHSHPPVRGCSPSSPRGGGGGGLNSSLSAAQSCLQAPGHHHSHPAGRPVD